MQLEQRDKELAAIGAAIGCNCQPCAEHHIPAGQEAGLTETELGDAVSTARAVRDEAIELLAPRIDELLGRAGVPVEPVAVVERSREQALVAVGATVGVNSHGLLERHIAAALEFGLSLSELAAAVRMAGYVQKRASEMTGEKATQTLDDCGTAAARPPQAQQRT
jgi:4-carboxymuconolactone decarboxylase